ncbi:MAG: serine/threonine-protein kinase [Deltaproteobacteria bacterium]|nr:serine/threonine-protein kinase [Deltaproteobacteria bacterium]
MGVPRGATDAATPTVVLRGDRSAPGAVVAPATVSLAAPESAGPAAFNPDWSEAGRYALVAELARGGGGTIAIAHDRKLGRKVALKRPLSTDGDERLAREALVLARLEHPSIVPIHDAGYDAAGAPYYTMKLVGGETLAARIKGASTFEARLGLLGAVTAVADAMAYAHGQQVIHRDLKPGNVLVGAFGEVAVIDWGLGKILGTPDDTLLGAGAGATAELTGHGAIVGTPAYMAPEQATGGAVDARADVYALGAMLYHVLTGEVPYGRATSEATLAQVIAGAPPPITSREDRVPRDLAAIVQHAMARDPAARYPTARERADDLHRYQTGKLVAAHRYRVRTRVWRWLRRHQVAVAAAVAGAAITTATVALLLPGAVVDETCADVDAPVRAIWSVDAKAAGARAFAATGLPYAAASWRTTAQALDAQAADIGAMRIGACRATRVTRAQPEAVMVRRMDCLDRRVAELRTVVAAFGNADAALVAHAPQALGGLGRVEDCADVARLGDLVALPADPVRRAEILAVEDALDELGVVDARGQYAQLMGRVPPLASRAIATGYGPIAVDALLRWAQLLVDRTDVAAADALLRLAATTADRAHDDVGRGRALAELARIEADHGTDWARAAALADEALAVAERTGDPKLQIRVLISQSHLALSRERFPEAIALARQARALAEARDPDSLDRAIYNVGVVLGDADQLAEASAVFEEVVERMRAEYGTDEHPDIARALGNLAAITYRRGHAADALAMQRRARAIEARVLPPTSLDAISSRRNLANMEEAVGQVAEARAEILATLRDAEVNLGPSEPVVVAMIQDLGRYAAHDKDFDEAIARYREAATRAARRDPSSTDVAEARSALGGLFEQLGRSKEALPELEAALAVQVARLGPDGYDAAYSRAELGRALLDTGDATRAVAELTRSLRGLADAPPGDRGMYRTALSQALWQLGRKAEARAVAAEAHAILADTGDDAADARAELAGWEKTIGN